MASNLEFVQFVTDQLGDAGNITSKRMFGEYGLYCNGKFFAVICDNQFFIKITDAGREICGDFDEVPPYEGAKPYFLIENLDDRAFLAQLAAATCSQLPDPKPRKKKDTKERSAKTGETSLKTGGKLDYKKVYRDLYLPKSTPAVVDVPEMTFIMVDGRGNPNTSKSYQNAVEILYGLSFTIKMSKLSGNQPEGYFEYVVPPLEGLWKLDGAAFDGRGAITDKDRFCWTAMIRQPEFVTEEVFEWAKESLLKKKPHLDFSAVRLETFTEGLCCQVMHRGPYDEEPVTIEKLEAFISEHGYQCDISEKRLHHEIYLGDPRKTKPENLKTVLRHPVRPVY
ncbi:GyrI-like domain-containing protein [Ruminococcus sp. OA3]|uniref:GyrI-like domain-containing protein n=1 Tax=Ruminococcus sp. OA3 TaxID=2914164 RepID=UPI0031F5ADA6